MTLRIVALALFLAAALGSVVELTPDNFDTVLDGSKHVFVEFFAPWCGHCKSLAPDWESLGDAIPKSSDVVIAKVDADAHKELGSRFDVHGFPTLKWFPKGSKTPEDYNGGRSLDELSAFVTQKSGEKPRFKKSVSHVVVLDSSNFEKIVTDTSKDVFVEFYAPWCGHCKRLAPDYEVVGTAFAAEDGVVVAKIDCDPAANKEVCSKYDVSGFPTLKWFPKSDKSGQRYDGARGIDEIITYINNGAGTSRDKSGALGLTAGRLPKLDELVEKFLAEGADKLALIKKAEEFVASEVGHALADAKYYVKIFTTAVKQPDFPATEVARLDRLLASDSLTLKKRDEFSRKKNILSVFVKA